MIERAQYEPTIYGDSISGNCYKLQLVCAQLDIDYVWREVDIMAGEARTPEYRAMNAEELNDKSKEMSVRFENLRRFL